MTYFSSLVFFCGVCIVIIVMVKPICLAHMILCVEIYFFILWFVDSVTILPYMLTYMYWDTNIVHVIILLYIFIIVK